MNFIPPLASADTDLFAFIAIMGSMFIIFMRVVMRHQQRMAEIKQASAPQQNSSEVSQLRSEVSELKQMIHEQMITMDSLIPLSRNARTQDPEPLQQRLEQLK